MDFYRMYIESNAYYVNHRITSYKYSDNEFIHRLRAFKGMHITTFMPLYLGLLPLILWGLRKKREEDFRSELLSELLCLGIAHNVAAVSDDNHGAHVIHKMLQFMPPVNPTRPSTTSSLRWLRRLA